MAHMFIVVLDDNRTESSYWQVSAEADSEQALRANPYHNGTVWPRRKKDSDVDHGAITLYLDSSNEPADGRVFRITRSDLPKMHAIPAQED
jgi:hypothetical protein